MSNDGKTTVIIESKESSKMERWISSSFAGHTILCMIDGKSTPVKFTGYHLDLNLSDAADAKVSKALRESSRYGRDIFIVGEKYAEHDIQGKTEMLDKLQQMELAQIVAMFTMVELQKAGVPIPPSESDKSRLIAFALNTKSI